MQEAGAQDKFNEAQKAYETLSDKQKRATYDQARSVAPLSGPAGSSHP